MFLSQSWLAAFLLALVPLTKVRADYPFDTSSCVDPNGVQTCLNDADSYNEVCETQYCPDFQQFSCGAFCEATYEQRKLACIFNNCWNQIYSCASQDLALNMLSNTLNSFSVNVPPALDQGDYSGGCSCPIYFGYMAFRAYNDFVTSTCVNEDNGMGLGNECDACGSSAILSFIPNICPGVNGPGIDSWYAQNLAGASSLLSGPSLAAAFEGADCTAASIGYTIYATPYTFYAANAVPTGSLTPSDHGVSLTAPPYTPTTWALIQGGPAATLSPVSSGAGGSGPAPSGGNGFSANGLGGSILPTSSNGGSSPAASSNQGPAQPAGSSGSAAASAPSSGHSSSPNAASPTLSLMTSFIALFAGISVVAYAVI